MAKIMTDDFENELGETRWIDITTGTGGVIPESKPARACESLMITLAGTGYHDGMVVTKIEAWFLRESLGRYLELAEWSMIETADKERDGKWQELLLWVPSLGAVRGRWNPDTFAKRPRPYWDYSHLLGVGFTRGNQPTHWRPLIAGPGGEDGMGSI